METTINYREELEKAREAVKGLKRDGYGSTIDAYWEVCCGDVLVTREWENSSLAEEFLDIATYLEGYDHMLEHLYSATSRMVDTIFERPRLKLRLLNFELMVLRRIEAQTGHDMSISDDVSDELSFYYRNIKCADSGDFENIEQPGSLKHDPIEWSAEYERIIDEAGELLGAVDDKDGISFLRLSGIEELPGRAVYREYPRLAVYDGKTFGHIVGYNAEFLRSSLRVLDLALYKRLLLCNPHKKR